MLHAQLAHKHSALTSSLSRPLCLTAFVVEVLDAIMSCIMTEIYKIGVLQRRSVDNELELLSVFSQKTPHIVLVSVHTLVLLLI